MAGCDAHRRPGLADEERLTIEEGLTDEERLTIEEGLADEERLTIEEKSDLHGVRARGDRGVCRRNVGRVSPAVEELRRSSSRRKKMEPCQD